MNKLSIRAILFLLLVLPGATIFAQCAENEIINLRKTAIVFGEKSYKYTTPLNNPLNDAHDISDSLKKIGFEVLSYRDVDLKTMKAAIDDWTSKLSDRRSPIVITRLIL